MRRREIVELGGPALAALSPLPGLAVEACLTGRRRFEIFAAAPKTTTT